MARHRQLVTEGRVPNLPLRRLGADAGFAFEEDVVDAALMGLDAQLLEKGRLVVWMPDDIIPDGVGEIETKGYLDCYDMPPWETWVAYVDGQPKERPHLVSWVPEPFVDPVQCAIDSNALGTLLWLKDAEKLPDSDRIRTPLRIAEIVASDNLLR